MVAWTLSLLWVKTYAFFCFFLSLLFCSRWLFGVVGWLISFRIIWVFNSPNNLSYIQSDYFFFLTAFCACVCERIVLECCFILESKTTTAMRARANNETACWFNRLMYTVLAYDSVLGNCAARVFVSGEHSGEGER